MKKTTLLMLVPAFLVPAFSIVGCSNATDPLGPSDDANGEVHSVDTSNNGADTEPENTTTANGEPKDTEEPVEPTPDAVKLTAIHDDVFVGEGCTSGYCHGTFGLASPQSVINAFVDVEATNPTCGRTHYVVPGDPEASILWVRVRPITAEDESCGVIKMPAGSETGLDEQTAQIVYDWIADGAHL
jgi:hypothetical protein